MSAFNSFKEEFREIENCGGKMELSRNGEDVSMSITAMGGASFTQMGISLDGERIVFMPMRGIDQRPPKKPSPIVPAFLPADKTGLFGRQCPKCKGYFRTSGLKEYMTCPYCDCGAPVVAFTTENQRAFLNRQRELWNTAFLGGENVTIDLDKIGSDLPQNRPSWTPKEQQQQFHFVCEKCQASTDILGEYASCPACQHRNSLVVLKRHLGSLENEWRQAASEIQDSQKRSEKWDSLLPRFVSAFEAMGDDIRSQLVRLPMLSKRRKEVEQLSFQQIVPAEESLRKWFGVEIFAGLKQEDKVFLNREFNRRHLLVHKAGRVDDEYLKRTEDQSVKLHQRIRVKSKDIARLSKVLFQCANNLFDQFSSIS